MLWCQHCTLLSCNSDVYAALGIFNCGLQFPWLNLALCVLVHSLTLCYKILGSCDASLTTGSLMAASHHMTIYFLLLQSDGMIRSLPNMTQVDIWVWVCCWKVYTCVSLSYFIHTPRFSVKDFIFHPWKNNWPTITKLPYKVGIKRQSS